MVFYEITAVEFEGTEVGLSVEEDDQSFYWLRFTAKPVAAAVLAIT